MKEDSFQIFSLIIFKWIEIELNRVYQVMFLILIQKLMSLITCVWNESLRVHPYITLHIPLALLATLCSA